MKKILMLLCLLALLMLPTALADDTDAIYTLVSRVDGVDTVLGSGVVFLEQDVLLTAESCYAEGTLLAIGPDGEHAITGKTRAGGCGLVLLKMDGKAACDPIAISDFSVNSQNVVYTLDGSGQLTTRALSNAVYTMYRGREALLMMGGEGVRPGAIWLDVNGALMGMVCAQSGEGKATYIAADTSQFYGMTYADVAAGDEAFLPISCTAGDGVLNISWESSRKGGNYIICVSGMDNYYYTTYTVGSSDREAQITVPCGVTWDVQVQWAPSEKSALPPAWLWMQRVHAPGYAMNDLNYQQECYIGFYQGSRAPSGMLEKAEFISADMLMDKKLTACVQVTSIYDVDTNIKLPLVISLIAPDGQIYFEEDEILLSTKYENGNAWRHDLSALLSDCAMFSEGGVIQPGEYTVQVDIGGRIAGTHTFQVERMGSTAPAATEVPAPAATTPDPDAAIGFVTDLQVEEKDGMLHIDWSRAADLPQGDATYWLFHMYDGNQYFSRGQVDAGEMNVELPILPDRNVHVWITWTKGDTDETSEFPFEQKAYFSMAGKIAIPAYTRNGFTHVRSSFTLSEPVEFKYMPQDAITREVIESGRAIYFQTEDTYQAEEESADHPMIFALYAPDGAVYTTVSSYIFMPDYAAADIWGSEITGLFNTCAQFSESGKCPDGSYTFTLYIDGCTAASHTFTLE